MFLNGRERGIRTLGDIAASTVFKTVAFDHSAISPFAVNTSPVAPFRKPTNIRKKTFTGKFFMKRFKEGSREIIPLNLKREEKTKKNFAFF